MAAKARAAVGAPVEAEAAAAPVAVAGGAAVAGALVEAEAAEAEAAVAGGAAVAEVEVAEVEAAAGAAVAGGAAVEAEAEAGAVEAPPVHWRPQNGRRSGILPVVRRGRRPPRSPKR